MGFACAEDLVDCCLRGFHPPGGPIGWADRIGWQVDPVQALRQIAFAARAAGRAYLPGPGVRPGRTGGLELPGGELDRRLGEGTLRGGRDRPDDRRGHHPGRGRSATALPGQAAGRGASRGARRRCARRCAATATRTRTGPTAAARPRDGRGGPRLGHEWIALTDHSPRLTVASGLSAERLGRSSTWSAGSTPSCPVPDPYRHRGRHPRRRSARPAGGPARPARRGGGQRALQAADGGRPDDRADGRRGRQPACGRARPLHRPAAAGRAGRAPGVGVRPRAVFAACREHGVAVEINCRPERLDPPGRLLRLAAEAGCLFSIDTDAHAPGQLDWLDNGCRARRELRHPAGAGDQYPDRRRADSGTLKLNNGHTGSRPRAIDRGQCGAACSSPITLPTSRAGRRVSPAIWASMAGEVRAAMPCEP